MHPTSSSSHLLTQLQSPYLQFAWFSWRIFLVAFSFRNSAGRKMRFHALLVGLMIVSSTLNIYTNLSMLKLHTLGTQLWGSVWRKSGLEHPVSCLFLFPQAPADPLHLLSPPSPFSPSFSSLLPEPGYKGTSKSLQNIELKYKLILVHKRLLIWW